MSKALLGRKLGMSQVFSETGEVVPVTLVVAEPNVITIRRTSDKDGHNTLQLGLPGKRKNQKENQKLTPNTLKRMYSARREFSIEAAEDVKELSVEQFTVGEVVEVSGISKGKGFQGVVKRHGFKGGPASHGHSDWERKAGSIGSRFPQHVRKGKRMAGRMGSDRVTVKNLVVVSIDAKKNLLAIKGALPGKRGTVLEIRSKD
ncbi:MAG: 50S ribosomal protein L3 [Candidatus Andersenbacteria bacterium]|nr:50S ribosomal protein L3 [Candidatus Andersenbacteria bacterium]MBI3251041.1 50S ribosomal protein L3 [Candidatus Andersenbacteria bacterium]